MKRFIAALVITATLGLTACAEQYYPSRDGTVLIIDEDGDVDSNNYRTACGGQTPIDVEMLPGPSGLSARVTCP